MSKGLARTVENVWQYPRPPALERVPYNLKVIWQPPPQSGASPVTVADSNHAWAVKETSHPPTYYFPPGDVRTEFLRESRARHTMCEWKGVAHYWDLIAPEHLAAKGGDKASAEPAVKARIWSYPSPTPLARDLQDHFCFYPSPQTDPARVGTWECFADGEKVQAQEGNFYGGWVNSWISGGQKGMKGGPGTWGW
ncbi:mRNA-decapping enzyme subunit 2 [Tilletia horrida]|uniref:mRNA-decapping enzyme subunit 2 n=1 Tax=Tilletia horrida TaxID=155126 RepID=A0AAN6GFC8_9BASI|nr:mRNA-decapping enzyme subunit 2 [Tilletia horrida]KAK0530997.1 mRNA-decapping enzyme subunit 2 [Tilletia horrida]KAK0535115.1 mRNA-decapping enzyme subunit 2 [Tilletia horrida]KAK0558254.1 mRNA-decapping enzyme subunit 2 [Tilletia horrida]